MKYNGYWAEARYSEEDKCFWGEVGGLEKASITFEGNTIEELKEDFKNAIDFHINSSKANNEEPERPKRTETQFKDLLKAKLANLQNNEIIVIV